MNKTVNINIGGFFFHVDEDAYQKLSTYFDAIKRSLSNTSGKDEIMKDIEMRVAELFTERQKSDKHVISILDVEQVITIMGQPEDYRIDDDAESPKNETFYIPNKTKKLYRDIDTNILGGVGAGLGHYLGVDAIWIRLLLIVLLIGSAGTMTFIYLIFWILLPEAKTTSERLEMRGEPVNLSNIEKKVREGFDRVSEEVQKIDYDKFGRHAKSGAEKITSSFGELIQKLLHLFGKIIGAFILIISISTLASLIIGVLTVGTASFFFVPWQANVDAVLASGFPLWLIVLLGTFAIGIPFFFLMLLGLKLLVSNLKTMGSFAKYSLVALWFISVGTLIFFGINQARSSAYHGKVIEKINLNISENDTLQIKLRHNENLSNDITDWTNLDFIENYQGSDFLYSNTVKIKVLYTETELPYMQIEKLSKGKSTTDAKKRASKINYFYEIKENQIIFDNYLLTKLSNQSRDQEVILKLYLPKGFKIMPDISLKSNNYYFSDASENQYLKRKIGYQNKVYAINETYWDCLNCDDIEEEILSEETETTILTIDSQGVKIKKGNNTSISELEQLEINENGIIIKTQNND